jgi:hypothetical protein
VGGFLGVQARGQGLWGAGVGGPCVCGIGGIMCGVGGESAGQVVGGGAP